MQKRFCLKQNSLYNNNKNHNKDDKDNQKRSQWKGSDTRSSLQSKYELSWQRQRCTKRWTQWQEDDAITYLMTTRSSKSKAILSKSTMLIVYHENNILGEFVYWRPKKWNLNKRKKGKNRALNNPTPLWYDIDCSTYYFSIVNNVLFWRATLPTFMSTQCLLLCVSLNTHTHGRLYVNTAPLLLSMSSDIDVICFCINVWGLVCFYCCIIVCLLCGH